MSLFHHGLFRSHSGIVLPWKIDCDYLTDADIDSLAKIIRAEFLFSNVIGVPNGGLRLAEALRPYCKDGHRLLVVDDVLTTGRSMEKCRHLAESPDAIGVVIFARGPVPSWISPMFVVQEWTERKGLY